MDGSRAEPGTGRTGANASGASLMEVRDLAVHFPVTKGAFLKREVGRVKAVDGVSFSIRRGEVLGLVGESGCGKTTLARSILKLVEPTAGQILIDGADIWAQDRAANLAYRRRVQAVFQDPFSSLNPRMTVGDAVAEPFRIHHADRGRDAIDARVRELLDLCGLPARLVSRYPHEMSGGQRQRVGIARALALEADLIVCDEAVSALDVSIQAQVINLLEDLRRELDLTYLFIGHDLGVIRHLCDRVAVMYLGRVAELAEAEDLFDEPLHPYTRALLSAIPVPDPTLEATREHVVLSGEIPSPLSPPSGCVFHPRCPRAVGRCEREPPTLREERPAHLAACLRIDEPDSPGDGDVGRDPNPADAHGAPPSRSDDDPHGELH